MVKNGGKGQGPPTLNLLANNLHVAAQQAIHSLDNTCKSCFYQMIVVYSARSHMYLGLFNNNGTLFIPLE